jgi:hypothetical protein
LLIIDVTIVLCLYVFIVTIILRYLNFEAEIHLCLLDRKPLTNFQAIFTKLQDDVYDLYIVDYYNVHLVRIQSISVF